MPKISVPFETLLADLHGPDWTKRCDAARLLGQSKDPRAVDALLPDLQDPDWRVRRNAAQALGALKSARAVPGLLQALKDRTATVRERAAVALGRINDSQTLPALIQSVLEKKDSHIHVNEGAYQAVRKFGRRAGPHLLEAIEASPNLYLVELLAESKYEVPADLFIALAASDDPAMRRTALTSLGKSSDPRAVDYLAGILAEGDAESQLLAVQSLTQLGAVEMAPRMLNLLKNDGLYGPNSGLCKAVSAAFQTFSGLQKELKDVFPVPPSKISFGIGGVGHNLAEVMGMLGDENFRRLNQMLEEAERRAQEMSGASSLPPQVFQAIADQTWKVGAMFADGREARTEHVRLLLEALETGSPLRRAAAALSLPWYRDAQALDPLERRTHDPDELVRRAAVWAYAALKDGLPGRP